MWQTLQALPVAQRIELAKQANLAEAAEAERSRESNLDPQVNYYDCAPAFKVPGAPSTTSSMRILKLSDIKPGKPPGILKCRIASEPAHRVGWGLHVVAPDSDPQQGMLMFALYNLDILWSPLQISQRLAIGREIIVRNPFGKTFADESFGVRVDDPSTLEFLIVQPRCFFADRPTALFFAGMRW